MVLIQSVIFGNSDYYPAMVNGAQVLHNAGIRQTILCSRFYSQRLPTEGTIYPSSTNVHRLGDSEMRSQRAFAKYLSQVWQVSDRDAFVFVGYDLYGFFVARLLAWRFRRPLIYHIHDYTQWHTLKHKGQRIAKLFELLFARTAELVIVPDADRADVIKNELRLRIRPTVVANASLSASKPSTTLQDILKSQGKSFVRVVFRPGHIGPDHALEATIRSIPLWKQRDWGFVIMGPADPSFRDYLMRLARELDVSDQFVILPAVPYHEVAGFTVGADLGHGLYEPNHVNNRYITTASNKIMEYIAAGLPILLSESLGSRALLTKYQLGTTVDVGSHESIANAVNRLFSNSCDIESMRAESRRAFEEEFNYTKQYEPVIDRLHELASTQRV